jgi:hypothetical protein
MNMKRFMNKKVVAIGLAAGITLGAAGAAFAYFTSSGSGPGSASVGTSNTVTISQTGSVTGLVPGGAAQPVAYSFTNTLGNGAQNFGLVSLTDISVSGGLDPTNCNLALADIQQNTSASVIGTVNDGATFDSSSNTATQPSIQMLDTGTNQNACQGATVSFTITAAAGS